MRISTSQQMRMSQQMKLAPRMIQSMEILQMPLLQLEERVAQELESNPTLEAAQSSPDAAFEGEFDSGGEGPATDTAGEGELAVGADASSQDDFARLDRFGEDNPDAVENMSEGARAEREPAMEGLAMSPGPTRRLDGERDAKTDAMANTAARGASLTDQLLEQWRLSDVEPALVPLGELLISFIEDDGYLRISLEEVASRRPPAMPEPEMAQLELALQAVQLLLEPPGVGARDVRECLLLQIDALLDQRGADEGEHGAALRLARELIETSLDDLSQNRLPKVAERAGVSIDDVQRAMESMRRLSLAPGRALAQEQAAVIVPDATVEYDADQDRYIAYLNDGGAPALEINRAYAEMARDRGVDKQTREFLKKNLSNATWLIDAVEQRQRTLQRVLNVVVDAQRDFFDQGEGAMRPLAMTQVAEQLGLHVATVSRAVSDKHLLTPRGVVALRKFFTGGTKTESGEDASWEAVRAALQEIVDEEDKSKPLSDEALSKALKGRGLDIARRTVAKYRGQMDIPSARLRKQYA